ncbi:MAG: ATP-binding protein [Succiniclasticum sp.]|uniref:ATP-binding protein n=1 Tax=Succiniclasticum sp. TaxID=2775030 RepID=UPI002A91700F|nr:ATP-binding protein [Succiniclasticum sp.]MDY6290998.1 ATP-binding protein [Succiniclasticum sp.]
MENEKFILDFIDKPEQFSYFNGRNCSVGNNPKIATDQLLFLKVTEITYKEKAPRKEALENVLSSIRVNGINFIYLIVGDSRRVTFYYGVAKDLIQTFDCGVTVHEIGERILKSEIEGNFRGSSVEILSEEKTKDIIKKVQSYDYVGIIDGVPGSFDDDDDYRGVERLVDTMQGEEFAFLVIAKPLPCIRIRDIEKNIYGFYDALTPFTKKNVQNGDNESKIKISSKADGTNSSEANMTQDGTTRNHGKTVQKGWSINSEGYDNRTDSQAVTDHKELQSNSHTESKTVTNGSNTTITNGENESTGKSKTVSREYVNKDAQEWLKYLDEVLLKRLDYGKGKGVFITTVTILTKEKSSLIKLGNTVTSLFSGSSGNKVPLNFNVADRRDQRVSILTNFQIPILTFIEKKEKNEVFIRSALSQYVGSKSAFSGNWLSVDELGKISGLPQKEVTGISLSEEVEFGLNFSDDIPVSKKLLLGKMVQSGKVLENVPVYIDKTELSKHTFVTGVTGSGKTTTCQNLLLESELPFLVIEPAKTEYRILSHNIEDLLVFTIGKDKVAPLRLNPFEFYPHETIASHVDMIKASIEAAFDMEAAIPQIIEKAIYECYADCGWDINNNENKYYEDPFSDEYDAFPTLSELFNKIETVVSEQGFDMRLKNDYIGSIKARLQGLLVGAKGTTLNARRSIDFRELLHKHVVLELEEIRNGSEKALIMGFILANLTEAIKSEYYRTNNFRHITLVEEAHRLLEKYVPGDSLNKKQGVEMFANMLSEIRKYGESLVIVDQIPSKLTTDVLKNTNTKIVHKLFAQDDKEVIGNTMLLKSEQKDFLSSLATGRAVVFSHGWKKSIQIQVPLKTDTGNDKMLVDEKRIRERVLSFYCEKYQKNIFPGLKGLKTKPDIKLFEANMHIAGLYEKLDEQYYTFFEKHNNQKEIKDIINKIIKVIGEEGVCRYLLNRFYYVKLCDYEKKLKSVRLFVKDILMGTNNTYQYDEVLAFGRRK